MTGEKPNEASNYKQNNGTYRERNGEGENKIIHGYIIARLASSRNIDKYLTFFLKPFKG